MNDATKALEQKDQQIARLSEQVTALQQQLDWFKRQLFGRKSERQIPDNSQQGSLFDSLPQAPQDHREPPSPDTSPTRRSSRKKRQSSDVNDTGLRFDESVPQRIIEIPAPELSGPDAEHYEVISHEDTCRLAQEGGYVVLIYRRQVVRHKQHQTITAAAAPSNVLEGCYADVSYLAGLMVDKAVYHLPLYRQHQRLLDSGVTVSRSTLINWIQKGIELLRPIYRAQWQHILDSGVLAMDEVPIKAGVKKGAGKTPGKMKQSYFWPIYGDQDEMAFTWSPGRGMVHAVEQLKGFSGTLLTDGYTAYTRAVQKLNAEELLIEHANCWAHCRRAFEKALQYEPEGAQQALDQIAKLYRIEKHLREKELNSDESLNYRQQYSEPIVNEFFKWVHQQRQRTDFLPSNPLAKALAYAHERQIQLKVFLANPHVPIDTNHLERGLRVIPMGRKNYLFCWSEIGAEQLGILQSLMVTCRLQGVNPHQYLVDVLQRVSLHPAKDVIELTPRVWKTKFSENFLTSDVKEMG